MRITWLIAGALVQAAGGYYSPLASTRYRVLVAAGWFARWGHQITLVSQDTPPPAAKLDRDLRAELVVVAKVLSADTVRLAERAKVLGSTLVLDVCDNHFDTPKLCVAYYALCQLADVVVASTPAMAEIVRQRTSRRAVVVGDPFEAPLGTPAFAPRADRLKLAWFGNPVNFDTVAEMVPDLAALGREMPVELVVVSNPLYDVELYLRQVNERYSPAVQTHFVNWSPQATWQALAACDAVVVPSKLDERKVVKSPNRVVESLRSGRFVSAFPLPSYEELAPFVRLEENVAEGLRWALAHREEVLARVQAGQEYVGERFAPEVIARQWAQTLLQPRPSSRESSRLPA